MPDTDVGATALLAECRASPTAIAAGDARWPAVRELEVAGLVRLEWWGPRATVVRVMEAEGYCGEGDGGEIVNTDQATESLRQSLADGDKMMSSKTWSGGAFKSEAIRQVLAASEAAQPMHDAINAFLNSIAAGTGPGGSDPVIARRDLLESPLVQAMADAADGWKTAAEARQGETS